MCYIVLQFKTTRAKLRAQRRVLYGHFVLQVMRLPFRQLLRGVLRTSYVLQIREMPPSDRPRERLSSRGVAALTDEELVAVLLGTGGRGRDVLAISKEILGCIDREGVTLTLGKLQATAGVGLAKASVILAALEFARRRIRPKGTRVSGPADILPLVAHLVDRQQEYFICISLNGAHEVIATRIVTIGLVNSSQVHPREVFSDPLKDRACAIVVCHNHPSGNLEPSKEDKEVTKRLVEAGKMLGIQVLDHVIFGEGVYYSFQERGELSAP